MPIPDVPFAPEEISYADFGEAFVLAAVTEQRVVSSVRDMAGETVRLGPLRAGPVGAAVVTARGTIGEAAVERRPGDRLAYRVQLPVHLSIHVRVGTLARFGAEGTITLLVWVRTVRPLAIVIDIPPVTPADVAVQMQATNVSSRLMQSAADVEGEMREQTADYVNERLSSPEVAHLTRIELLPFIEQTWASMRAGPSGPTLAP